MVDQAKWWEAPVPWGVEARLRARNFNVGAMEVLGEVFRMWRHDRAVHQWALMYGRKVGLA